MGVNWRRSDRAWETEGVVRAGGGEGAGQGSQQPREERVLRTYKAARRSKRMRSEQKLLGLASKCLFITLERTVGIVRSKADCEGRRDSRGSNGRCVYKEFSHQGQKRQDDGHLGWWGFLSRMETWAHFGGSRRAASRDGKIENGERAAFRRRWARIAFSPEQGRGFVPVVIFRSLLKAQTSYGFGGVHR